jgi:hypothetical protein
MSWEDKGNIPYVAFIINAILAKWLDVVMQCTGVCYNVFLFLTPTYQQIESEWQKANSTAYNIYKL